MPRSVNNDFDELSNFVEKYSLANLLKEAGYTTNLKQGHQAYLVLLTLWSIIDHYVQTKPLDIAGKGLTEDELPNELLRESISDFGSAFFSCMQGAYKPGHMALRSNIENFVRSLSGLHIADALTTTSVYGLFDLAKESPPFKNRQAPFLANLKQAYKELCKYSHSASLKHMAGICALKHFPSFDPDGFTDWVSIAKKVVKNEVACILSLNPSIYLDAHFKSKEILDLALDTDTRLYILGGKQ
jgi:hypothetical protein